jgi:biopolymer transport protein ExbB/TolQ
VVIDKSFRLVRLKGRANAFEKAFWSGTSLDELYRGWPSGPTTRWR